MSAPSDADVPLFEPAAIGLPVETWDELQPDAGDAKVRCTECRRPVRSRESRLAQLGTCCAGRLGRAVQFERIRRREAADQPGPDPPLA